jgi:hypothetical protein
MQIKWTSLVLICTAVAIQQPKAEAVPACRDVSPAINNVCYTETPFSMRQRDEGGTKKWKFIVERWAPGWIIVDWSIIKDSGTLGTYSWPNGSIVSSSGNASLISETRQEKEQLSELKSEVQGKVMGCYGPVCGELQQKLQNIDREIKRLTDVERSAISAGGNEKILFVGTTYVDCSKILGIQNCGGGAKASGVIRVNQRYIGTSQEVVAPALALANDTRNTLQRLEISQARETVKEKPAETQRQTPEQAVPPLQEAKAEPQQESKSSTSQKNCKKALKKAKKKCLGKGQDCINKILEKKNCPVQK